MSVSIIEREEWGARPFKGTPSPMHVDQVVLHHAAGFSDIGTKDDATRRMQQVQRLHQTSNGWVDVGYHLVISRGGHVLRGRPEISGRPVVGAHSPPNTGKYGICLLGCFHPPAGDHCRNTMTVEQRMALIKTLRYVLDRFDLQTSEITVHSDHNATACPGDTIRQQMDVLRREVAKPDEEEGAEHHLEQIEYHVQQLRGKA